MTLDSIENPPYNPFDPLWDFTTRKSILYIRLAQKKSHRRKHLEAPSNTHTIHAKCIFKRFLAFNGDLLLLTFNHFFFSSVRSSNSHPDLLVIQHQPLFQITPVLDTGLSLSEPLQLYKGYNAI